jgi:hypothetical protein
MRVWNPGARIPQARPPHLPDHFSGPSGVGHPRSSQTASLLNAFFGPQLDCRDPLSCCLLPPRKRRAPQAKRFRRVWRWTSVAVTAPGLHWARAKRQSPLSLIRAGRRSALTFQRFRGLSAFSAFVRVAVSVLDPIRHHTGNTKSHKLAVYLIIAPCSGVHLERSTFGRAAPSGCRRR